MIPRLAFALVLGLASAALHAADQKPAYLNPNYTGPKAPTGKLPDLDLPASRPFVHPGILLSQADLDFVRARLAAKEEPWTGALAKMRANEFTQLNYKPKIIPVINPHDNTVGYLMKDAAAAYGHAVLWCVTGERAHADNAIEILDYNAATLKEIQLGRSDQGKTPPRPSLICPTPCSLRMSPAPPSIFFRNAAGARWPTFRVIWPANRRSAASQSSSTTAPPDRGRSGGTTPAGSVVRLLFPITSPVDRAQGRNPTETPRVFIDAGRFRLQTSRSQTKCNACAPSSFGCTSSPASSQARSSPSCRSPAS